ncbi:DUF2867 domain-containing protein [Tabrizicola sp.]|uniref:DUF2867 domain-containing protein n=1 Tax=Tabrizicola sp. TaxID=2005166 RepID=UPI003F300F70
MPNVRADTLPRASSLWSRHQPGDFIDCYSVESSLTLREAASKGLTAPSWVRSLLALRNRLVRPFGLKTGAVPGTDAIGIFPILKESADEMILGLDDRHLDFRVALFQQDRRVYMSTWVRPHNLAGRIYLRLVMPFHIVICRGMVARMAA